MAIAFVAAALSAGANEAAETVAVLILKRHPTEVIAHLETLSGRTIQMDEDVAQAEMPVTVHFINYSRNEAVLRMKAALRRQADVVIDTRGEQWRARFRDPNGIAETTREILARIVRFAMAVWEPLFSLTVRWE